MENLSMRQSRIYFSNSCWSFVVLKSVLLFICRVTLCIVIFSGIQTEPKLILV